MDLKSLSFSELRSRKWMGKGSHGVAYDAGDKVLKHTHCPEEYEAAIRLMEAPQPWAVKFFDAAVAEKGWLILREKVELPASWSSNPEENGCLRGYEWHGPGFENLATSPVEMCHGRTQKAKEERPLNVRPFTANELHFLASLYPESNLERACFLWFQAAFHQAVAFGINPFDLWSNVGIDALGRFLFFDVHLLKIKKS